MRVRNIEQAIRTYQKLLHEYGLTEHEYAIVTSSLVLCTYWTTIRRKPKSTYESCNGRHSRFCTWNSSVTWPGGNIIQEGEYERAYRYIKIANDDAYAYGAKFRKVQIAHILPVIESAHMNEVEGKRKNLLIYSLIATFISLMILVLYLLFTEQP